MGDSQVASGYSFPQIVEKVWKALKGALIYQKTFHFLRFTIDCLK